MRNLLIVFGLLFVSVTFGQSFNDLTDKDPVQTTDQFTVVNGAGTVTYKMSYVTLFKIANDSLADIRADLIAAYDSLRIIREDLNNGVGAGGAPGDTVTIGDIATLHSDLRSFVFGLGANNTEDTGVMQVGAFMGGWFEETDTIVGFKVRGWCGGGTISCRIYYGTSPYTSGTSVTSSLSITGGSEMTETSFITDKIPPGNWIYCEVTSVGTLPEQVIINFAYTRL